LFKFFLYPLPGTGPETTQQQVSVFEPEFLAKAPAMVVGSDDKKPHVTEQTGIGNHCATGNQLLLVELAVKTTEPF